jgi:FKBP-type peptidyl-prolyl cis-trans isomerase 2
MKKIVIALAATTLVLSACSKEEATPTAPTTNTPTPTPAPTPTAPSTGVVASGSVVSVDYTLTVDGKVVETSMQSAAEAAGLFQSGATYQPLQFQVGAGNMIKGFDDGVLGMKAGEKKTITVSPENGYGTGPVQNTVLKAQIAPTFTINQDVKQLEDTVTEVVAISQLGEEGKDLTVGKVITGGNGVTAEVLSIEGENATLKIENAINPFYKKERKVGSTSQQGNYIYTIKSIVGTGVTIDVINNSSPFAGKDFAPGVEADTPAGKVKIVSIDGDNVVIDFTHPLAGKTLTFDVEVKEVR